MSEQIIIKNQHQIEMLRKAGRLTAMARAYAGTLVRPGITTKELDDAIGKFIKKHGGYPSFYHLYGFKGAACISINDEIISRDSFIFFEVQNGMIYIELYDGNNEIRVIDYQTGEGYNVFDFS